MRRSRTARSPTLQRPDAAGRGQISYRAVRNHGTIGGSVALADPAADWPGCPHRARRRRPHRRPQRHARQPVADFVQGLYATTLATGEIILGFDVPRPQRRCAGASPRSRARAARSPIRSRSSWRGQGQPGLGRARRRRTAPDRRLRRGSRSFAIGSSEEQLRAAIADDLKTHLPDPDAYEQRLHTSTSCGPPGTCGRKHEDHASSSTARRSPTTSSRAKRSPTSCATAVA